MKYLEQKVHSSFSDGPNHYLRYLNQRQPETQEVVSEIIDIENWLACDLIRSGKSKLQERTDIASLKGAISSKLQDIKKSIGTLDHQASSYLDNLLEFKKKNHWLH
jgi:hypothetical protein